MQKQLPDLILSFFYCLEDTLEDAAAVGVDVETYPVFDSHADLRAIVRKSGTSEKCAEFDISGEDADDYRMHGFVAYSELGEQFHAAILRMPHAELDYPVYSSPTDSEETAIIAARIAKQFEAHTCETDFSAPQTESLSAHYSFLNSESATLARFDFDFGQYPHAVRVAAYSAEGNRIVSEFLSAINATEGQ